MRDWSTWCLSCVLSVFGVSGSSETTSPVTGPIRRSGVTVVVPVTGASGTGPKEPGCGYRRVGPLEYGPVFTLVKEVQSVSVRSSRLCDRPRLRLVPRRRVQTSETPVPTGSPSTGYFLSRSGKHDRPSSEAPFGLETGLTPCDLQRTSSGSALGRGLERSEVGRGRRRWDRRGVVGTEESTRRWR